MRRKPASRRHNLRQPVRFDSLENLEPRVVLDGDWSAADGASVFGSWGDGGYLTVTTIDLNNEPIVFERSPGGSGSDDGSDDSAGARVWQQIALLTAADGSSDTLDTDALGRRSLAVHDDRLILGAPNANGGAGAAAVFHYQIATKTWVFETLLDAPGLEAGEGFGWSVDIHGETAVIGTRAGNAAYVFHDSGSWSLRATLTPDGGREGRFGSAVATDGGTIVVGAPGEEGLDGNTTATSGAVYLYERDGNQWGTHVRMDAPQSARDGEFGNSVAVHSGSVIVGAWLDDDMGTASGSVFAIGRHRGAWQVEAKLTPTSMAPGARLGHQVAASGSRAGAVGLGSDDGSVAPFAQVFKRRGDRWSLEATLDAGQSADAHWRSIDMQGDRVVLGSNAGAGAAVIFRRTEPGDQWVLESTVAPSAEEGAMMLAHGVALHDDTVLLGGQLAPGAADGTVAVTAGAWVIGGTGGTGGNSAGQNDGRGPNGPGDDDGGNGNDDGSGHDQNDDNGGNGNDDGAGHDQNDDNGGDGNDDGSGHDQNDDNGGNGNDDGSGHDQNDDNGGNGNDDGSGDDSSSRGRWVVRRLGALPDVGTPVSDILTWTDSKDGQTYAAVATDSGLVLFTRSADRATWTSRDLTAEIAGAEAIAGDISVFGARDGMVYIVGYTADGDMVIFRQDGTGAAGAYGWSFRNISETDLTPRGFTTPRFAGGVVSFVTRWNAMNIAGLDDQGRVRAVWTTPGMDHWRSDDLSASSGAPEMAGQLAVFLTPWGGINLAGTDQSGALQVTWWVPGFDKWVTSNFNDLFDGPSLDGQSVSAYTTPWGGLNITGRDDRGDLVAYWWVPQFGENRDDDYWRVSNLSEQIVAAEQPAGTLQGLVTPDGTINLFGTNAVHDVLRYFWEPGEHWKMENLTHTALPV
jgi:hypothetical protein